MSRYLTTQERVDLAVKAGHHEAVMEYIRMHNNGEGVKSELETLKVTDPRGDEHHYTLLPPYAVAAVDSYLNTFNIPLVTTAAHEIGDRKRHPTMAQLAKYAKTAAEDAVVYRGRVRNMHRPQELIERLASALEYEAIDTNFQILVACANARALIDSGITLTTDVDTGTQTLKLSNGAEVEMHLDAELDESIQRTYVLLKEAPASGDFELLRGHTPVSIKLIGELEEEVDRQLKL